METFPINYLALLAAAVARQAIGALWYSPALFGRTWMQLTGCDDQTMRAGLPKAVTIDFIASFVMAFVFVHVIHYTGAVSMWQGAAMGALLWLGFTAVAMLGMVLYEKKPFSIYAIVASYQLVALIVMGGILAIWQ